MASYISTAAMMVYETDRLPQEKCRRRLQSPTPFVILTALRGAWQAFGRRQIAAERTGMAPVHKGCFRRDLQPGGC
jgi:hypothetical protein